MEEFYIVDNNNNKFNKLYLKLFLLIKFKESMNIILKLKKENIENNIEETMMKEEEVKDEIVDEVVEDVVDEIVKKVIKEEKVVEEVKREDDVKNNCKKNLEHSEKIDIMVNGDMTVINLDDDISIDEEKDYIYEEKLNTGLKDVDIGCGICCSGCKKICEYLCYNLQKCCDYIVNKCNKINNN